MLVNPPESVAVSRMVRIARIGVVGRREAARGRSGEWSGSHARGTTQPLRNGSSRSASVRADAGSGPSSGSVALPLKLMVSPTVHVRTESASVMLAVGSWLATGLTTISVGVGIGEGIRDPESDGDLPGTRIGADGLGDGGVVVLAVAVEVPGVGERVTFGIGASGAVELDLKRGVCR